MRIFAFLIWTEIWESIFSFISCCTSTIHDQTFHFKYNICRFFNFNKYLLKPVISDYERLSTPGINSYSRHDKDSGHDLEKRLRYNNIDCSREIWSWSDRYWGLLLKLKLFFFLNKNSKLVLSINLLFLSLKANKAHIQINASLRLKILVNILKSANNRRLDLRCSILMNTFLQIFYMDSFSWLMDLFYLSLDSYNFIW